MTDHSTAIITGGGRGIGRAIALRLARAGFDIVVAGIEPAELAAVADEVIARGRRSLALQCDVTREDQVRDLVERTLTELGRIDVLVNNAAIIGPTAPVVRLNRRDWDEVLAVNLTGPMLCAQAVLPHMIGRRSGRIINIASIAGKIAYALRSPYAVSKWGLLGLTLTLAREVGEHNIQVNAICPGPTAGPRMTKIIQLRAAELGQTPEEVEKTYLQTMLLRRLVDPEHVAELAALLAGPAGASMTGQILDITAGYGI